MTLRISTLIALFALAAPIGVAGVGTVDQQAAALVRAMRAEEVIAAGMKHALIDNERAKRLAPGVRACLAEADLSFVHGMYVEAIKQAFTPAEIATALAYYQSHAGYMDTMLAIRQDRDKYQGNPLLAEADAAGEPSKADLRRMKEFAQTSASSKIGQIHTAAFKQRLGDMGGKELAAQCLKQP